MRRTIDTQAFYGALVASDLDFFCGVPDSLLASLCSCIFDRAPHERSVICANEGNAVAMACGYHVATGKRGVVYMQNSGEGNAINPLLSIADPDVYGIPMLLLIGWRGEPGVHDEPQHAKQGKVTCSLLDAMGTPYQVLDSKRWEEQIAWACSAMDEDARPVALVIRKGTFSPYPFEPKITSDPLSREEALGLVLDAIGPDDIVVSTTGKESREVFEIRERCGHGHDADFLTVGGMGHTLSIAAGMAMGAPGRIVWCLDGDGSMLMHLGSLPVLAQRWPDNLRYVLNINGAHESVGGQPNVAGDIDVCSLLVACGLDGAIEACTPDKVISAMEALKASPKIALVLHTHQGSRDDLGRPTVTPANNKRAMMRRLGVGE